MLGNAWKTIIENFERIYRLPKWNIPKECTGFNPAVTRGWMLQLNMVGNESFFSFVVSFLDIGNMLPPEVLSPFFHSYFAAADEKL